jgi:hypothetical protein
MFAALTDRSLAAVRVVQEFITHHESLLASRDAAARQEVKLYSVSSSVTRLYGIFEHYVETLIADYLDVIPELCAFDDLSESMRKEYRVGISHLLNRLDGPRYSHLNHGDLIRWYHEALVAQRPYRFVPEALTRHDENLRLPVLSGMLKRVQLDDLQGWLTHHDAVTALYEEPTAALGLVETELKNFVELRNDAAHGSLSTLPGTDALQRHCQLVSALVQALSSYFYREVVLWRSRVGKARLIGEVTEVFERPRAFIVPLTPGSFVSVHEAVHLVGRWSCVESSIESMQIDGNATDGVGASDQTLEVGLVASVLPKRNVMLYADVQ